MASGGSTPPNHLPIPQLSANYLSSTTSETLQTPKLSLTPNLSLGGSGGNSSKSFTSLEELLNITGINSPDSRSSGSNDNGVDSLHKIAQAVESGQHGSSEPPAKKPRLESPSLPSNIRVQPLTTSSQPSVSIASLLHKRQFTATNHTSQGAATTTVSNHTSQGAVTTSHTTVSNHTALSVSASNDVAVGVTSTGRMPQGVAAVPGPRPVSTTSSGPLSWSAQPSGAAKSTAVFSTLANSTSTPSGSTITQPTTVSTVIPSLMQPSASISNPKSFLLQLVQLFKHYQAVGDTEGMARIKTQLNVLVSARQGPILGTLSLLNSASSSIPSSTAPVSSAAPQVSSLGGGLSPTVFSRPSSQSVPPSLLTSSQPRPPPNTTVKPPPTSQPAVSSGVSVSAGTSRSVSATPQVAHTSALAEQVTVQQKAVKQLQNIMASLPAANRPKTAQEIREFVQKYSSLISQIQTGSTPTPTSSQSNKTTSAPATSTMPSKPSSESSAVKHTGPIVVPLNFGPSITTTSGQTPAQPKISLSTTAMAQVDQHFQNSLTAANILNKSKPSLPNASVSSKPPAVVDLTRDSDQPQSTVQAPVTSQFNTAKTSNTTPRTQSVPLASGGIQAGIATPLPPGLTLETLAVLCRLPESELEKLKLPVGLLSAIKVWKDRQPAKKGTSAATKATLNSSKGNIPVLFPPSSANQTAPLSSSPLTLSSQLKSSAIKVGDAVSLTQPSGEFKKPYVIPSSVGFPPRSLHAYVPAVTQLRSGTSKFSSASSTPHRTAVTSRPNSHHMTRYRTKADQERAEKERIQALTKALQSSEEARIAFRFGAHLEKMHSQLLSPDTSTPFHSRQDVLARLLPYHVYAESEPPIAAVEKADAVFESVAQVLLSRSKGLRSRFQQMLAKSDSEGGEEMELMEVELGRCFLEGEHERIQQEKLEKQQAEQVAADLSMMVKADGSDTFDSEFSLNDAFFPFLDNGIT